MAHETVIKETRLLWRHPQGLCSFSLFIPEYHICDIVIKNEKAKMPLPDVSANLLYYISTCEF